MAAQIAAAERLRAEGVDGIGLLFVVDEENGKRGRTGGQRALAGEGMPLAHRRRAHGESARHRLQGLAASTLCTAGVPAHRPIPSTGARR